MTTFQKAIYEVKVDLNGDRLFTDTYSDITAYVTGCRVASGFRNEGDRVSQPATLILTLDNESGRFSPEGAAALAGFVKGIAIRVRMTYGGTTVQLYSGRIDHLAPKTGTNGARQTKIRCDGFMSGLFQQEVAVPIQINKRADEIATAVLTGTIYYPPTLIGWFLGITGFSELGVNTTLATGPADYADMEAGVEIFLYAGDSWHDGVDAYRALMDVVLAEAGWLYEDPADGRLHLWNRHHRYQDLGSAADVTLTGADLAGAEYEYGETIINDIEISYTPRLVGASATDTLGVLSAALLARSGQATRITVRFDDGSGNRISALSAITPVRNTDFTANSASDGSGIDYTSSVECKMTNSGDKADLIFTNIAAVNVYIQAGARVRGQKLTNFGEQVVKHTDDASVFTNGKYASKKRLPIVSDSYYAEGLAKWIVGSYANPVGNLRSVKFSANGSSTLMVQARDRRIGDKVALSEQQTGADGVYFIMGIYHDITPRDHRVTWLLEQVPASSFWALGVTGYSELGVSTILGI